MNIEKEHLILGGVAIGCLAVGGAGGYFAAKKHLDKKLPEIIADEIAGVKKQYTMRIRALREKAATPAEQVEKLAKSGRSLSETLRVDTPDEISKKAEEIVGRQGYKRPETPAVAYDRIVRAKEEGAHQVEAKNIWANDRPEDEEETPVLLRNDKGRFVSPREALEKTTIEEVPSIQVISTEDFVGETMGYEQVNLVWFFDTDRGQEDEGYVGMLVDEVNQDEADKEMDIRRVGGIDVLSLLPGTPPDSEGDQIIFVRNHDERIDYEIKLDESDLTAYHDMKQS